MTGLVTQDFQVEFDGLLMGVGTPYQFKDLPGFLSLGGVRAPMTQRARQSGGFIEPHYAQGATRTATFNITGTPTVPFNQAVSTLRAWTFAQTQGTRPMWFQLPGQGLLTGAAQVVNRDIPVKQEFGFGLSTDAAVQFYFPDPLWYGATLSTSTLLPSTSGGLVYPIAYPEAFGTTVTGRATCSNAGSADVSPIFTVIGPHDNGFQVTSLEDGITLQYNGPVGANDTVVIDTRTGAVTLNGPATPRNNLLSFAGVWPVIPAASLTSGLPGVRTFAFATLGAAHSAAQLTVSWAPAYS